jgi:hypothetical protein
VHYFTTPREPEAETETDVGANQKENIALNPTQSSARLIAHVKLAVICSAIVVGFGARRMLCSRMPLNQ